MLADISAVLRDHEVSIESLIQRGRNPGQAVPIVLTSHDTTEARMRGALGAHRRPAGRARAAADDPNRAILGETHERLSQRGPQPRPGHRPRDRGRGTGQRPADRQRRREGRRPGRRRRHAPGAQRARHRRHGGDRRGRARRGADALHRREGRHRPRAQDRHRPRSARRHHDLRQGRPQRDRLHRHGAARLLPERARHLHGQDRRRRRPAARRRQAGRPAGRQSRPAGRGQAARRSRTWWC